MLARRSVIRILALLAALAPSSAAMAEAGNTLDAIGTTLLVMPVIAKASTPLILAANGIMSNGNLAPAGVLGLLWTVPNAFLIANLVRDDTQGIRLWRTVNLFVDGLSFGALLGLGLYEFSLPRGGGSWADLVGALTIALSIPFGVSAGIDLIPFPAESRGLVPANP